MMLVRSGVRRLVLADFDRVEASNLNRQLYFPDQLGRLKTEALAETLTRIEPDARARRSSPSASRATTSRGSSAASTC